MSLPLVSIVIPCYQYGRFLGDCVRSALNQTDYPNVEVIVINDASTDNTEEVLGKFHDSRLKCIRHERNQGSSLSITEGLTLASGKYVCRIDADDRHLPDFLLQTVPVMESSDEVGAVCGTVNLIDTDGNITAVGQPREHDVRGNRFIDLLKKNFVTAPTLLARNELWKSALPIPTDLTHTDWYLNLQIARRAVFVERARVLADYRVHSSNLHTQLIVSKLEEPSTFHILERMYQEQEKDTKLQQEKERARDMVYASQYADLFLKYFGARYTEDAKRCFDEGTSYSWKPFLTATHLRLRAALALGLDRYEKWKALVRGRIR